MRFTVQCLFFCALLQGATGGDAPQFSAFDEFVNGLLAKWGIRGAALGVSQRGRLKIARGYGTTAVEGGSEMPSVVDTLRRVNTGKPIDPGGSPGAYLFRQIAPGVDVALLFNSPPAGNAEFDADVSTGIARIAGAIKSWPPIDLFVNGPELSAEDVINAADRAVHSVVPGETVMLFPSNAGPETLARLQLTGDGRLSTSIAGTRVLFDGIAAPLAYAARGQICAIVPYALAHKQTTQVVVEYQGARSAPVTLSVADTAPASFTFDLSGKGQAAMLGETGCCVSPRNPAMLGSVVALYATGEGQTRPAGIDGRVAAGSRTAALPKPLLPVKITVGGMPAEIVWAGEAPHMVGSLQVNFRVPVNAPVGDAVPLVLTVGNIRGADGVTMAIRSRTRLVMVMEEEPDLRRRLRGILERAGYQIIIAQDGRDAMAKSKEHPIDLVISSLAPADAERPQLMRRMLADRPELKIIATARALGSETLRASDLIGAQVVLTEPLTAETVRRRVRELLRSRPVPYVAGEPGPRLPINGPA